MPEQPWTSHAPPGYDCPFCGLAAGRTSSPGNLCEPTDLIYQDDLVMAFMACDGFGNYGGHVMVTPVEHVETLYELSDELAAAIMVLTRQVAVAMKAAWQPEGVSTRQHNEPAGNQHVWHYHQHIFPRYADDNLYRQLRHRVPVADRARKALELQAVLEAPAARLR